MGETARLLGSAILAFIGACMVIGCLILTLMYGWGLTPKSWW